jgi:hypothetical protein
MSFLTEAAARRMALTSRAAFVQAPRQFTTGPRLSKSMTENAKEKVQDTLQGIDRKVSDKLVDGINAGGTISSHTLNTSNY